MRKVAHYAARMAWPLPKPASPIDLLARESARAAREEVRHDEVSKKPHRANRAIPVMQGEHQYHLWH